MTDDYIKDLARRAIEAFERLSPAEQAAHRREQAISFVYGQLRLSGIAVSHDQVAAEYDQRHRPEPSFDALPLLRLE